MQQDKVTLTVKSFYPENLICIDDFLPSDFSLENSHVQNIPAFIWLAKGFSLFKTAEMGLFSDGPQQV